MVVVVVRSVVCVLEVVSVSVETVEVVDGIKCVPVDSGVLVLDSASQVGK